MGLFHKSKTPEKALVDEIWEEIKLTLSVRAEKIELAGIVEKAYEGGASCAEIQRVYEENLSRYSKKPDDEVERLKAIAAAPVPWKEKRGCLAVLAAVAVVIAGFVFLFSISGDVRYDKVTAGGLDFYVPQGYALKDSGEDAVCIYQKYEDAPRASDDSNTPTYYLEFYVFESMTVYEALSYLAFDDSWELRPGITYGEYTGARADVIVLPFRNTVPQWFLFEKGGKTVAVFWDNGAMFEKRIAEIIDA